MQVIHKPKHKPELMTQTELLAYVHELEAENARLEEGYQKSVGVIAATDCVKCKKDAEPVKHGRWIETSDATKKRCSECDVIHLIAQYPHGNANYCPNCGAKMDGGVEDECKKV